MVEYRVEILRRAQKQLARVPTEVYPRLVQAIRALAEDPRPNGCLKLQGREGWRVRVGRHRVLYEIDDSGRCVLIVDVGDRREIYR